MLANYVILEKWGRWSTGLLLGCLNSIEKSRVFMRVVAQYVNVDQFVFISLFQESNTIPSECQCPWQKSMIKFQESSRAHLLLKS